VGIEKQTSIDWFRSGRLVFRQAVFLPYFQHDEFGFFRFVDAAN
jgi:hypothetical protein